MKKVALLVATVVLAAAGANAAPAKAKRVAAAKKAGVTRTTTKKATEAKPAAVAPTATTPAAAPATATESSTGARSGGETSAQLAVAAPAPKKSKFTALIIDRASVGVNSANRQLEQTEAGGELTVRAGYKVTDSTTVSAAIDADHSYGMVDNGKGEAVGNWVPYDVYLMAAHSNLATLPGGIKAKGYARFYLPTSEDSQEKGQILHLRTNLTLEKAAGKWTFSYNAQPQYYFQQYKTYRAAKGEYDDEKGQTATRNFRLLHWLHAEFQATAKLSAYTEAGLDHGWYNTDSNAIIEKNTKPTEAIYAETGVQYAFNDNLALIAGLTQDTPDLLAQKPNQEGPMYRDEFAKYFLEADVSF